MILPNPNLNIEFLEKNIKKIYLAGGCFWGIQYFFSRIPYIKSSLSGYANGNTENPTYEDVCYKNTGFCECVEIAYDYTKISLKDILDIFFQLIDPTSVNRQGNDMGTNIEAEFFI